MGLFLAKYFSFCLDCTEKFIWECESPKQTPSILPVAPPTVQASLEMSKEEVIPITGADFIDYKNEIVEPIISPIPQSVSTTNNFLAIFDNYSYADTHIN